MARVLFLLPARDFDPGEAAISWRVLVNAGHAVSFATPDGRPAWTPHALRDWHSKLKVADNRAHTPGPD